MANRVAGCKCNKATKREERADGSVLNLVLEVALMEEGSALQKKQIVLSCCVFGAWKEELTLLLSSLLSLSPSP